MAVLVRYGERMAWAAERSELAPLVDENGVICGRGEKSVEGYSSRDFLMEVITQMMEQQAAYAVPEFVGKDEADPMTDNWVASVVEHDSVDAHRKRCRHQRILTSARAQDPGSWLCASRQGHSAEKVALRRMQHLDNLRRLRRLPERLYGVAVLAYQGWKPGEIAETVGVSRTEVWRRLQQIHNPRIRAIVAAAV